MHRKIVENQSIDAFSNKLRKISKIKLVTRLNTIGYDVQLQVIDCVEGAMKRLRTTSSSKWIMASNGHLAMRVVMSHSIPLCTGPLTFMSIQSVSQGP